MTTTISTLVLGGRHKLADLKVVNPDAVTTWTLEHKSIGTDDELEAGRRALAQGLIGPDGTSEPAVVLLSKGRTLLSLLLQSATRQQGTGEAMTATADTIAADAPVVVREFGALMLFGKQPTAEEIEASKKPATPVTTP